MPRLRTILLLALAAGALCLAPPSAFAKPGANAPSDAGKADSGRAAVAQNAPAEGAAPQAEPLPPPTPEEQAQAQPPIEAPIEPQVGGETPAQPVPSPPPTAGAPGAPQAGPQAPAPAPVPGQPLVARPRPLRPTLRGQAGAVPPPPTPAPSSIPSAGSKSGRPLVEPASATPPSDNLNPTEPINFNFEDSDLLQVVQSIAPYTGKNFDVPQEIAGQKVTIIMHSPIPASMAFEVLESVLASRNFSLVPSVDGKLYKVVPAGQGGDKVPLVKGKADIEGYDRLSTHIVGLQNASAQDISTLLQNMKTQNGVVDVYAPTNTLIITDTADAIRRMLGLIEVVDVPGENTEQQIFMLEYTDAETMSSQIQDVLTGGQAAGQPGVPGQQMLQPPRQPARPPLRPAVPGAPRESTVVGAREPILRIVPDTRLNALIVVASPGYMEQVRDLVDKLDTPTPFEAGNMHIYELQNANAEDIVDALNSLTGRGGSSSSSRSSRSSSSTSGDRNTERNTGGMGSMGGGQVGGGGGGAPSAQVNTFEREVSVTQYEVTNSLLIVASPQDYKRLTEIIARLDVPQRQVHVDAVIMEVGINDDFSLAVESAALSANDYFALNNVVDLANLLTQGPLAASTEGTTLGILNGTTKITATVNGQQVVQTIPNVPLLITALESITDLNVLSQPSLTTVDNQEANIVDGLNIPFVRGTSSSLDQSTVGRSIFNSVDRQDVGMKLKVKPQISEGDYVYLELEVELSQPVQSSVGADPNIVGPTIQKTNVTNNVVIKDGSIGVIGGFLRETTDRSVRQPPVLGDVPLVGWLFRRKDNTRSKRNLVMLVTPHVIKERKDLDRVSDYKLDQFQKANDDAIYENKFFKRVQRKQEESNKRHPSMEKATELQQERQGFGRGTIER
jgi:general secretion pathway protein D